MSAFDIAGAVVWTPLAAMFLAVGFGAAGLSATYRGESFWTGVCFALAAAFCIARLFGARL